MLYCFHSNEIVHSGIQKEMDRAKDNHEFIYYDKKKNKFFNELEEEVDVSQQEVTTISGVLELEGVLTALEERKAIIPNTLKQIEKIEHWYRYFKPKRDFIYFKGSELANKDFCDALIRLFSGDLEVFLKTVKKDFNGVVALEDLVHPDSDLRKAFSYHPDDEFIISRKVHIDQDDLGNLEYRSFIKNGKIMNVSRVTDYTYHKISDSVISYVEKVIGQLPDDFPTTFVLDVFCYDGNLDVLEFNPLECSGKYLYNSVFSGSVDLTHEDITRVPIEKQSLDLTFEPIQVGRPSTLVGFSKSFAKDYSDIQEYGDRVEGSFFMYGELPTGVKLNMNEILENAVPISSDDLDCPLAKAQKQKNFVHSINGNINET